MSAMGPAWDRVQASLVTVRGRKEDGSIATRAGFFLSSDCIVISLFSDDDSVTVTRVHDWQDKEITFEVLASDYGWDLHLARVASERKGAGFRFAATVPPNVGDVLRVMALGEYTEFEFEGVRELHDWGTFLRISCTEQQDGAPLLNEDGGLVGVALCRLVDDKQEQFGLPLSCVFPLLQSALYSASEVQEQLNTQVAEQTELIERWKAKAKLLRKEIRRLKRQLNRNQAEATQDSSQAVPDNSESSEASDAATSDATPRAEQQQSEEPAGKQGRLRGFFRDKSGEWVFEFTPEEQREIENTVEALEGYVINPQYADEVRCGWIARGLSNYAVSCALSDVESALSAALKAYSVYPLPIYLYDSACSFEKMGRASEAADLFRKFLASQTTFQPNPVQEVMLRDRDISEAIKDARGKIHAGDEFNSGMAKSGRALGRALRRLLKFVGMAPSASNMENTISEAIRTHQSPRSTDARNPEVLAELLFQEIAQAELGPAEPREFHLPRTVWPQFRDKMRLYRTAAVLMCLISHARSKPEDENVLRAYESLIFPPTPTQSGMATLEALRHAMKQLANLVDPNGERKTLSWSADWLRGIGHEETNPMTLTIFATYWMNTYIMVCETLKKLLPEQHTGGR